VSAEAELPNTKPKFCTLSEQILIYMCARNKENPRWSRGEFFQHWLTWNGTNDRPVFRCHWRWRRWVYRGLWRLRQRPARRWQTDHEVLGLRPLTRRPVGQMSADYRSHLWHTLSRWLTRTEMEHPYHWPPQQTWNHATNHLVNQSGILFFYTAMSTRDRLDEGPIQEIVRFQ